MTKRHKQRIINIFWYLLIALILIVFLFPLFWMLLSSLRTQVENTAYPPVWIFTPTLENYREIFFRYPYLQYTLNSTIVAVGATIFALLLGLPASYSISRYKQTGLALAILIARIAPGISFLLPLFILFSRVQMIDTYPALILTHLIRVMPLVIWIMIGFFDDVPVDLEDAARIDGCSTFGAFFRIALPLTMPGIAASAILCFIFSWNDFLFALVIASRRTMTLPVAAYGFIGYGEINWGGLTAAAMVITLPALILALFIQKHIVKGLTFGAVKG
ncbi:ABC transporter permease subunit [candidate division KSB3 bacterium]|uniref:ABC transporter permease subunit n=1 Tax=candidate division KSB3 bacterium TaxID=2044937 RepID=A0A9D5Q5B8_9BACT|nr:ABC transporter permease subunit [candidate division KSB3 bacterium]MBD3324450.1 ABC transporter permease subunit [candidate division KSB3 bacterium]